MNKKQIITLLSLAAAIVVVVTATVLLWPASAAQQAPVAPVPAVDVTTPSTDEQPQEAEPSQKEALEGNTDVEPVEPDVPLPAPGELSYEDYNAMSAASQRAYMESFEDVEDFFVWYYDAKDAYDAAHPDIEVGDGVIDLEDLLPDE